jgi:hypothetical protein
MKKHSKEELLGVYGDIKKYVNIDNVKMTMNYINYKTTNKTVGVNKNNIEELLEQLEKVINTTESKRKIKELKEQILNNEIGINLK